MRQNGYVFMTLVVIAPWLCWLDTVQKHSIWTSWWEKSTTAEITNCLCEWCMQTMNFARMHRNAVSILTLRVSFKINIPNKIDSNWFSLLRLFSCMLEESINAKIPLCSINASCIVRYLLFVIGKFIECELIFYSLSSTVQNSLRSTM